MSIGGVGEPVPGGGMPSGMATFGSFDPHATMPAPSKAVPAATAATARERRRGGLLRAAGVRYTPPPSSTCE